MNIDSLNKVSAPSLGSVNKEQNNKSEFSQDISSLDFSTAAIETTSALDKATGLLQTIVTDKLSNEVIRKMPPDEYLKLLSMIDNMVRGTVDKEV
ncbi:flagellar protein FlaG [Legionella feeleii]|uniref:FlaG protein n=1 Tax=Legionella feeleii TaxID=453 RepID=A0A0W0TIS6_9GAMM|nr:flagellar protein FlaG [Legionella feeleii]KTC95481.1 FlaG protein [Legionella feeleii]SPX60065.1 FlaG protein [Legionella feeleii]STX38434.1 FlaG protein [Legionella feeleii]